ncbi:MAG: zinc finger domain-containing protein [Candidatus Diapherotrites archaeon]
MKICTTCNKEVTGDYVEFKCPKCDKEIIIRCGHCRSTSKTYQCSCGFEGP